MEISFASPQFPLTSSGTPCSCSSLYPSLPRWRCRAGSGLATSLASSVEQEDEENRLRGVSLPACNHSAGRTELYFQFTLSFRDVEDLLAERQITVSYETVRRWVNHFGPMIAADLRKQPAPSLTRLGILTMPLAAILAHLGAFENRLTKLERHLRRPPPLPTSP